MTKYVFLINHSITLWKAISIGSINFKTVWVKIWLIHLSLRNLNSKPIGANWKDRLSSSGRPLGCLKRASTESICTSPGDWIRKAHAAAQAPHFLCLGNVLKSKLSPDSALSYTGYTSQASTAQTELHPPSILHHRLETCLWKMWPHLRVTWVHL